jgi:hypothetical protein
MMGDVTMMIDHLFISGTPIVPPKGGQCERDVCHNKSVTTSTFLQEEYYKALRDKENEMGRETHLVVC